MSKAATFALLLFLVSSALATELFEDTIEKTVPLGSNGSFSLSAMDGSVEIYGAETNEVKIIAIRRAFSLERLNRIQIEVRGEGNAVGVNTIAPPQPRWGLRDRSGTVDYVITLPQHVRITTIDVPNGELVIHGIRGAAMSASLGHGRLTSHNCFCNQTLQVERGGLDLFFDWEEQRPISVEGKIANGNVRAVIPGDASFELHAASTHGRVTSDFTEMKNRKREGASAINETIGAVPLSKLLLFAVEGNIRIEESP